MIRFLRPKAEKWHPIKPLLQIILLILKKDTSSLKKNKNIRLGERFLTPVLDNTI